MKVLIVEDIQSKAEVIAKCITKCDPSCEVLHASTAKEAYTLIASGGVNLVLLDIRLPLILGAEPQEESSVWLVREVQKKIAGKMPLIVGTTQYPDALARVEGQFREFLWTIIFVSADDERWQRQISYAVRFARSTISAGHLGGKGGEVCDVALVTALRIPEFEEVVDALGGGDLLFIQETGERWMKAKVACQGGQEISVVAACAEEMGMSAMAALVTRLCVATRPKRLLLTGIMGGNAQRVAMSDIIIIEETWDYRAGKITEKGFEADVSSKRCNAKLSRVLQSVLNEDAMISMFRSWKGAKPNALPNARAGAVACSPAVISDGRIFSDIEDQTRKVLGVEMEAYGCYLAAEQLGDLAPHVLGIKAVCDLGDKDKADLYQRYCAYLSARAALRLICDARFAAVEHD